MIIVDFSQTCINAIAGVGDNPTSNVYDTIEQLCAHLIYNKLRTYNVKFRKKYGEMIICLEGKDNFRYEAFPNYKCKRKTERKDSYIDWEQLYRVMDEVIESLRKYFPYKVLRVHRCEADDIIAVLAKYINEPNVIVSSDKDFNQLLVHHNVEKYDPKKEAMFKLDVSPTQFLLEQILTGDSSDSVPNIHSPDDFFLHTDGVRQKAVYQKYKDAFMGRLRADELTEDEISNFKRNSKLINLDEIPKEIKGNILNTYNDCEVKGDINILLNYFIENKFTGFLDCAQDFI